MNKKKTSFCLPQVLYDRVRELARQRRCSVSKMLVRALVKTYCDGRLQPWLSFLKEGGR